MNSVTRNWSSGNTIHLATYFGNLEVAKYLVNQNVDLTYILTNYPKGSPLHVACFYGMFSFVKYYVDIGVDVNLKDNDLIYLCILQLLSIAHLKREMFKLSTT